MQRLATVVPGVALTGSVQVVRVGQTMTTAAHHQDIVMQRLATVVPGVIQPVIVRVVIAGKTWTTATTPTGDHLVGTYLGMLPGGISAPPLSSVPSEVNYLLLGFAEDPSQTGNFEAFSMWVSMGITYDSIASDKAANPGRKYMISIGGSADSGGTFGIAGGMSVSQWVDNADNSISSIVNSYNADGVDIQVSIF